MARWTRRRLIAKAAGPFFRGLVEHEVDPVSGIALRLKLAPDPIDAGPAAAWQG